MALVDRLRGDLQWLENDLPPLAGHVVDPGLRDAWWWLAIPLFFAVMPPLVYRWDAEFYLWHLEREGYGFLEFGHMAIPLAAMVIALLLLCDPVAWRSRFLRAWLACAAIGCLYIAGEEASWGQHLVGWDTPARWAAWNLQQETNLHNMSSWLNQKPRGLLRIAIGVGGIVLPLMLLRRPAWRDCRAALLVPPLALMPTAILMIAYDAIGTLQKLPEIATVVPRPKEVEESFIVLFLLFYLIAFRRRIRHAPRLQS